MKSGDLRDLITIEAKTLTQLGSGEEVPSWSTFATVYASIEPVSGREYFVAAQTANPSNVRIRMRYFPGIVPQMRVVHEGKIYNVTDVMDLLNKHEELHLMCIVGLNEG